MRRMTTIKDGFERKGFRHLRKAGKVNARPTPPEPSSPSKKITIKQQQVIPVRDPKQCVKENFPKW